MTDQDPPLSLLDGQREGLRKTAYKLPFAKAAERGSSAYAGVMVSVVDSSMVDPMSSTQEVLVSGEPLVRGYVARNLPSRTH